MGSPSPRKDPDIRAEDTDEVVGSLLLFLSVRVGTRSWGQHLQKGTQASKVGMWTRPWGQSLQEETHISRWGSPITAVTCHEWPQASAHTEGGGEGRNGEVGEAVCGAVWWFRGCPVLLPLCHRHHRATASSVLSPVMGCPLLATCAWGELCTSPPGGGLG